MTKPTCGSRKARIVLVEDHPVTREGFAQLLNFEDDLQVCGQAATAAEALHVVARVKPNLLIADISLVGPSGLELIKDLAGRYPALAVLVLSTHDETVYAERALRAGARGYIMKSEPTERILAAIRQVLNGKLYLSERMHERLVGRLARGPSAAADSEAELLSDRELEVFQLMGQGQSTAQIAAALKLSPSTIATHRTHIQEKLNLKNLTELMRRAVQWVERQGSGTAS
jgi:DNA-binding NarL/FixJ family response regulator